MRETGLGKQSLLIAFLFGGLFLASCGSSDNEGTEPTGSQGNVDKTDVSGTESESEDFGSEYVILDRAETQVSSDELCNVLNQLTFPEQIAQLLDKVSETKQSDFCLKTYTGPDVKDLPVPDIVNETFETIRKNHPDLLVYEFAEMTDQLAFAQGYEMKFIKSPSILIEISMTPKSVSPTIAVHVAPFKNFAERKIWNYDYVVNKLQPVADQIAQNLNLKPMYTSYENGSVNYFYSIPQETNTDQLVKQLHQYLLDNGWNVTNYASMMGITTLQAQKNNIVFELANMQGFGQSRTLFSFTLKIVE
ncbi:MAG: hypothetical protein GXO48_01620 [Chlorobi bacterium]|nr:hypothetical protein [Chlorobiota bacterium]